MPRVKAKTAPTAAPDTDEELESTTTESKPARRGRTTKAKAKPALTAAPDPDDELDDLEDAPAPKRGSRKAKTAAPAKKNGTAAEGAGAEWQTIEVDDGTKIIVGDKAPRGDNQKSLVEFVRSRGRKATTVKMAMDHLCDELELPTPYADYTLRNCIYRDVLTEA